jgi:hypothetical protein
MVLKIPLDLENQVVPLGKQALVHIDQHLGAPVFPGGLQDVGQYRVPRLKCPVRKKRTVLEI